MNNSYLNLTNPKRFQVLCCAVGLEKAYILAVIHGLAFYNESQENKNAFAKDHYWTFATQEQLHERYFLFIPMRSLKRYLADLSRENLLVAERHNRIKSSRLWYRINYDAVNALCETKIVKMTSLVQNDAFDEEAECQNGTIPNSTKCQNGTTTNLKECQNGTIDTYIKCQNGTKESYTKCQNGTLEDQNMSESAKMAPTKCQNGTTIEIKYRDLNNIYAFFFRTFFFLKMEFWEAAKDPCASLDEFEPRLLDLESQLRNGPRPITDDDHKAKAEMLDSIEEMKRVIAERRGEARFDYDYDDQTEDYEEPTGQTAISLGDMIDKYGGLNVVG